jgi:cytochrome c553
MSVRTSGRSHTIRAWLRTPALYAAAAWLAASTSLAAGTAAAAAHYTDLRRIEPIHGDAAAGAQKAAACFACHGADGAPVAPTFPRLAGQRIDYLYHRLLSFRHAAPKDPYYSVSPMTPMAAALSDADMRDLAAYFASQAPRVADGVTAAVATPTGEDLFLHGNPSRGIPPCQGCHGAEANGPTTSADQYAAYPSLRGQSGLYVVARLTHFREGQPSDTTNAFIMHGIGATLDDDSIQAIAAWLGTLEPRKSP